MLRNLLLGWFSLRRSLSQHDDRAMCGTRRRSRVSATRRRRTVGVPSFLPTECFFELGHPSTAGNPAWMLFAAGVMLHQGPQLRWAVNLRLGLERFPPSGTLRHRAMGFIGVAQWRLGWAGWSVGARRFVMPRGQGLGARSPPVEQHKVLAWPPLPLTFERTGA